MLGRNLGALSLGRRFDKKMVVGATMSDHHKETSMDEVFFLPHQEIRLTDFDCNEGWVLDIGGGGEGIIGILKGREVIAIDHRKREVEETTNEALKIVMDARELKFLDESFWTATAFFTFLYVPWDDCESIFSEIYRVLKPGGKFLIWDASFQIPSDCNKKIYAVELTVLLPDGRKIETGYGAHIRDQDLDCFLKMSERHKFKIVEKKRSDKIFFIRLRK